MNVADAPVHIGLVPAVNTTETEGTTDDVTIIVIPVLVAVNGLAHGELDVRIQVTASPLFIVELVKVAKFVPAFTPFTCH